MPISPPKPWEDLTDREKIELIRDDVQRLFDITNRLGLAHQNLMSAHQRTADTLKEAVTELEKVAQRLGKLEKPPS